MAFAPTPIISTRYNVSKYKLKNDAVFSKEYDRVLKLCKRAGIADEIVQIDAYKNTTLLKRYLQQKENYKTQGISTDEVWVFHGALENEVVTSIMHEGFKVGGKEVPIKHGSTEGIGIYTSEWAEIAMDYSGESRKLILASGLTGKEVNDVPSVIEPPFQLGNGTAQEFWNESTSAIPNLLRSVTADSWRPNDYMVVFRSGNQLCPRYVIHLA